MRGRPAAAPTPAIKKAATPKEEGRSGPEPTHQGRPGADDRRARAGRDDRERGAEPAEREPRSEAELLDPMQRVLVQEGNWARPEGPAGPSPRPALSTPSLAPALDALVDRFLRRVAFSGGRQRGVAHLEIGSGELAGASVTISSEGGEIELLLDAPPGVDAEPYRALLSRRLEAKGVRATVRVR